MNGAETAVRQARSAMPALKVTGPDGTDRTVDWVDGSIGIGREPSNHLVLEHAQVGRWHAAIFEEAGPSYRLRDLGSATGTRVARKPIRSHPLREGDEFTIGPYRLCYFCDAPRMRGSGRGRAMHIHFGSGEKDPLGRDPIAAPVVGRVRWNAPPREDGTTRPSPRALFEALQAVAARLDVDELLECLLEQVERLAGPSVSFAALIQDDGTPDIDGLRARLRGESASDNVQVSQSVIDRTVQAAAPTLAIQGLNPTRSQELLRIGRAIGLPLVAKGRVKGLVYADWRWEDPPPPGDDVMEWLAALALYAGSAFENALNYRRVTLRKERLQQSHRSLTQIVGLSADTREVLDTVDRCAEREFDVLILGPTGTGKELVARRIHERSPRRDGPFVAVNCASIPSELFESEMFGHTRGAFSGAIVARLGRFQESSGGTLFLDELGELAADHQARLLRVLDERQVTPIGGRAVAVDLRIIAATNQDLERAVEAGTFREDLYNRLGIPIRTTPLKDRPEDIPILAYYLLDGLTHAQGEDYREISPAAMACLLQHSLPGNVRGLRRRLLNAVVFGGEVIEPRDLDRDSDSRGANALPSLEQVEADYIRRVLHATGGHQGRAAKILGVAPNTLKARMVHFGIERGDFQA
jgi:transcriptional regulator with GAF, ATPase, and Fis domain